MADQFRKSFDEMARQSELDELRTELEALRHERPLARSRSRAQCARSAAARPSAGVRGTFRRTCSAGGA